MPKLIIPKEVPRCRHIKTDGVRCGSPALRDKPFCFFHDRMRRRQLQPRRRKPDLEFPVLEDASAVQVALMQVIQAIADRKLDSKTAGLLLYALQTASYNLKRIREPDWFEIETDVCTGPLDPEGEEEDRETETAEPEDLQQSCTEKIGPASAGPAQPRVSGPPERPGFGRSGVEAAGPTQEQLGSR